MYETSAPTLHGMPIQKVPRRSLKPFASFPVDQNDETDPHRRTISMHPSICSSVATIFSLGASVDSCGLSTSAEKGVDLDRVVARYKAGRVSAAELKRVLAEAFGTQVPMYVWCDRCIHMHSANQFDRLK